MSTALERTDQCIKTLHNTIVHHWHFDKPGDWKCIKTLHNTIVHHWHFDKPGDWKCIKTLHNTIVHQEALAGGVF